MDELVKQVEILAETLRLSIDRNEGAFKLYSEKATELSQLIQEILILKEALMKSLSESDQEVDDLAHVTAALLVLQQRMTPQTGGQSEAS